MADCENSCTGGCSITCTGSCSGGCSTSCRGGCKGDCSSCSGSCKGACKGCSSCSTGCTGTCTSSCSDSCYDTCKGACYTTCSGQCKGYCSEICQTYCQTEQTYSLNSIGKVFSWTNPVGQEKTIKITASDWNKLKGYIQDSIAYCGGTKPTSANVASNDVIYATMYNDLANGIAVTNVSNDQSASTSLITAEVIDKLRTAYNSRQIKSSLPAGEYTGGSGECCQSGQVCMSSGQLLSHQICGNQTPTKCGDQTPGTQVGS